MNQGHYPPVFLDWSQFDQKQKEWPIPSISLLVGFFILGIAAPMFGGRFGIVGAFVLSAIWPTKEMRKYYRTTNIVKIASIVACTMMLGNLDALGDLLGSNIFRFSWFSLALAAIAIAPQIGSLKGRFASCGIVMGVFCAYQFAMSLGNTSLIRAAELNGSYLAAFLLSVICLSKQQSRDALVSVKNRCQKAESSGA